MKILLCNRLVGKGRAMAAAMAILNLEIINARPELYFEISIPDVSMLLPIAYKEEFDPRNKRHGPQKKGRGGKDRHW